ncbi:MAG: DUF4255 domain-containing protein [bacterium]|nr:DUF4255 domain-containing protein [bacterium]
MIHNILPIVCGELNEYLKSRYNADEDRLVLSNLVDQSGAIAAESMNKVVCSLVNVEEETTLKASGVGFASSGGSFMASQGDININLTVMFTANFSGRRYTEALKFLSGVVYFFQSKPVFTSSNSPGLTSNIEKGVFDLISLSYHDLNSVFSMMGLKYMPSVIYRIRMLSFSTDNIEDTIPPITGIGLNE